MQVAQTSAPPRGGSARQYHHLLPSFNPPSIDFADVSPSYREDSQQNGADGAARRKTGGSPEGVENLASLLSADGGALAAQARHNQRLSEQSIEKGHDLRQQQSSGARHSSQFRAALTEAAQRGSSTESATANTSPVTASAATTSPNPDDAASNAATPAGAAAHPTSTNEPPGAPPAKPRSAPMTKAFAPIGQQADPASSVPPPTATRAAESPHATAAARSAVAPPIVTPAVAQVAPPSAGAATTAAVRGIESSDAPRSASAPPIAPSAGARTSASRSASQSGPLATTQTAEPESRTSDANLERILRFVRTRIDQDKSTTFMRLDPPSLGTLRLRLELQHDGARLEIDTTTPLAHRLLSEQLDTLRRGLDASGIRLEQVEIRPPPPAADAAERPATPQSHAESHENGGAAFDSTDAFAGNEREAGTEAPESRPMERPSDDRAPDSAPVPGDTFAPAGRATGVNVWA